MINLKEEHQTAKKTLERAEKLAVNYNGKTINTKKEIVTAIFKQAGINFEGSEKFWESFNKLE